MNEKKSLKSAKRRSGSLRTALRQVHIGYLPFCFFRINDKSETEDLTQQVFLKAWQNVSSFKIKKKLNSQAGSTVSLKT